MRKEKQKTVARAMLKNSLMETIEKQNIIIDNTPDDNKEHETQILAYMEKYVSAMLKRIGE